MSGPSISLDEVAAALFSSWERSTSATPKGWAKTNPAWGQCAVTALVVHDFLGGEILRIKLSGHKDPEIASMGLHYFNRVNGEEIDLTERQFLNKKEFRRVKNSQKPLVRTREHLSGGGVQKRYRKLRFSVARRLSGNHPLFADATYRSCLTLALQSNCQKAKYGCVIMTKDKKGAPAEAAQAFNLVLEPLAGWCKPECIRMKIQSRTESMTGCCGHAEELALVQARDAGFDPKLCDLYVAGFLQNGMAYIKSAADFTCIRCATELYLYKVGRIFVPTIHGWRGISTKEALQTAKLFATKEKEI